MITSEAQAVIPAVVWVAAPRACGSLVVDVFPAAVTVARRIVVANHGYLVLSRVCLKSWKPFI